MKHTVLSLTITAILSTVSASAIASTSSTTQADTQTVNIDEKRFNRRALEAGIWIMPQVMYERMAQVAFDTFGNEDKRNNTVYYYERPMTAEAAMVTGNNNSPYVHTYHNIADGPVVVEIPPATDSNAFFGTFLTSWHQPIMDVGPGGEDKGKGGKYLIVPEGYEGNTDGYIVVVQPTDRGYISIRSLTETTSEKDMKGHSEYVQKMKIYPLGSKPTTEFVTLDNVQYDGHIQWDMSFWESANKAIQQERIKADEKAFYGMMKMIGIEKGQAFEPTADQVIMFNAAIVELKDEMKHDFTYYAPRLWGEASQWTIPVNQEMMTTNATYVDENWNDYSGRGTTFTYYFAPPASLAESKSTTYIKGVLDNEGRPLSGDHDYKVHIADSSAVPAERFYSFLTYSMETGAYLKGAGTQIGIASNQSDFQVNPDGSVDIHWSANCTDAMTNCMPLNAGEEWFSLFRMYGPSEQWFKFVPPSIERIN
ncbi:DUF1254 domain-containing protein [Vibrio breoganii]|uniref:DUF1254 domain-containing protein n=1 Tax=Vibrio breoganii TaxID=553239 RepID=UPI0002FE8783|nr:DUF1254 domain-containing protein [Vibrio breoganii]MDN3717693.1 DUF1254 domain-containing protein [Vibrio breoganii]OED94221.1 hypothetical protein A1QG_05600 [Vibrio breoganii ZF-29]OEF84303.1 hypothetical protein B003_18125 [Vibrio breoganii 1C10]PMK43804.1 hypothetical protein BCU00_10335 [Vibrio breoganii]PMO34178.1 hypothetical protein BCT12_14970 [Vibrio breoganii]